MKQQKQQQRKSSSSSSPSKNLVLGFTLLIIYILFQFFILKLSNNLTSSSSMLLLMKNNNVNGGNNNKNNNKNNNVDGGNTLTTTTTTTTDTINTNTNTNQNQMMIHIDLDDEIQKSIEYVQSIKSTNRKLIFVHIPKTAGTTLEEVGGKQIKVAWGSCLFNHRPKRRGGICKYCPKGQFEWPMKIGYWHLPTQLFPILGINPYDNADLFAVVRDPNQRLLSEFYYICRRKDTKWWNTIDCNRNRTKDPSYMNEWIQSKLTTTTTTTRISQQQQHPTEAVAETAVKQYLDHNGHFTPQYDFVVAQNDIRMIDYVLHIDRLQIEFPKLMDAYNLNGIMPTNKRNAARNETTTTTDDLQPHHFDQHTIKKIHEIYHHDFDLL